MERRIWLRSYNMQLYPNLYTLLIGPPGVGKGVAMSPAEDLWRRVPDFHVAPSSMSKASLMDTLNDAKRRVVRPGEVPPYIEYNSLLVAAREFGVLIPTYDPELLAALTDIYDSKVYEERKRTREIKFRIEEPILNLLGAATPNYLLTTFPEGAWEQGFSSRIIIIFSGENTLSDPLQERPVNESLFLDLVNDLKVISKLFGKMEWMPQAATAFRAWHMAGGPPSPDHPRLVNYLTRRSTHLQKLCMIASISRGNDLVIQLQDYQQALDWLIEAEFYMPDIFKAMVVGGDSQAIEECYHFVFTTYAKDERKPVPEHRLIQFLRQRLPAHSVLRVLELMVRSNMIEPVSFDDKRRQLYKPVAKTLHKS